MTNSSRHLDINIMGNRNKTYRTESLAAQEETVKSDIILIQPISLNLVASFITFLISVIVIYAFFGSYTRRTTVEGILVPDKGLVKIYPQKNGIITKKNITDGLHVKEGDILYILSTESVDDRKTNTYGSQENQYEEYKRSLLKEISQLKITQLKEKERLTESINNINDQLSSLKEEIAIQEKRVNNANDISKRYHELLNKSYVTQEELKKQEDYVLEQKASLMALIRNYKNTQNNRDNIHTELSNIDIKNKNEISEIERRIIDINTSLIYLKAQKNIASISPVNGKITNAIMSPGQSVNVNYPIATIIPDNSIWEAQLLVPSKDIGFIQNGMKTNIRYKSFPYQKFGQFGATIVSVSRAPLSSTELSMIGISDNINTNTGYYQVIAHLKDQTIKTTLNTQQLQAGMLLEADILHEKRRFYEWITDPILSLTKK